MSVICDTTKIKVFYDNEMWKVLIRGLKNRNGKHVKFMLSKDANLSQEELYTLFFERLEKGEFKQKSTTGGGVLRQHDDGSYFLDYPVEAPKPVKEVKVYRKTVDKPVVNPMAITSKSPVLFDTHDPAVRALVGSPVIGSTVYVFSEGDTCKGILDSVNGGFHIKTSEGVVVVPFIRELRPEPLNFNDVKVRRALLGTIIVAKDGDAEILLNNAVKNGTTWKVNGLSPTQMMNEYTFIDGSPIMASL